MNSVLIKKYNELSKKYPNLCFKYKIRDESYNPLNYFLLGIVTNNGPICFKVDNSLYDDFGVKELYEVYDSFFEANENIHSLDNLNLENVSYFAIKDGELYYYFGNEENINIPTHVKTIRSNCFNLNDKIKYVKGDSVEVIMHYAFRNNCSLEKLEFKRAITISNLLNVPNLKEIVVGTSLSTIIIEDDISKKLSFVISHETKEHKYTFDCNLEEKFLIQAAATKENDTQNSIVMIKGNNKKFRFVKKDRFDKYNGNFISICKFEKLFDKLPELLKQILQEYTFCIIENFEYGGMYIHEAKMLIFDMDNFAISFFHEIGHAFDFFLEKISNTESFKNIYQEEKDALYSKTHNRKMLFLSSQFLKHTIESEEEFFAEAFQRYFENDNDFYTECPKTYNFIQNLLQELQNYHTNNETESKLILKL